MSEHGPRDEERRVRSDLERLAGRAPHAFDPPASMLRRARRRLVAVGVGALLVASSVAIGGVAIGRALADRTVPPVPIATSGPTHSAATTAPPSSGPTPSAAPTPVACTFAPRALPELPRRLRKVAEANGSFQLTDADGASPDDVWLAGSVLGDFSKPAITVGVFIHWNGSDMTVASQTENHVGLGKIAVVGPDDAWATTGTGPLHWDGSSWSSKGHPIDAGSNNDLAISASGSDDVWAVGASYGGKDSRPFAEHFDGTRWTETAMPAALHSPGMALWGIAAIAPDDAWAVGGDDFDTSDTPAAPVVLHWDGTGWSVVDVPNPAAARYVGRGVAGTGPDEVWVAADGVGKNALGTPALVLHWDGGAWSQATLPSRAGSVLHLESIDERSPNDVWAAGSWFDPQSQVGVPLVLHFDGAAWTEVPLTGATQGSAGRIVSIRTIGDEVWAVGFTGLHDPPFVSVCR